MIHDASSGVTTVDLPWGVVDNTGALHSQLHLKEISGVEEDILADRGSSMINRLNRILTNCTTQIGTVTSREAIAGAIVRMTSPDRILALIRLRALSVGGEYHQTLQCQKCGLEQNKVLDLLTLEVKHPEDPAKRTYITKLPSGRTAEWTVMDGDLEEITSKVRQSDGDRTSRKTNKNLDQARISFAMWVRMLSLDDFTFSRAFRKDVDGVPIVDQKEIEKVQALSIRDRQFLRHEIEKIESGIDLEFEFRCESPDCRYVNKAEVDITQGEFFFPSAR